MNLTEILKDCPKGTKLYSPIFGDVYLDKIRPYLAVIVTTNKEQDGFKEEFLYDGRYGISGECMLFPSKDQRDWLKWHKPFVDGDVVYAKDDVLSYILIYHKQIDERVYCHACLCLETDMFGCDKDCIFTDEPIDEWRLATEKEKQKLFDAIKANGYRWNPETKTLEKLKKEKFDPKTLQPFDKVLVKHTISNTWCADLFSHYDEVGNYTVCTGEVHYNYGIPYNNDTKHLVGKSEEAPEFYRYWDE